MNDARCERTRNWQRSKLGYGGAVKARAGTPACASSGGALTAFGLFPVIAALIHPTIEFMLFSFAVSGLIAIKHKGNIERLRKGTENRIGQRG